jgi:hypothetical protein
VLVGAVVVMLTVTVDEVVPKVAAVVGLKTQADLEGRPEQL